MADENPKDLFQWVEHLSMDEKIREALDPVKCLTEAAQIRALANRMSAAARELDAGEKQTALVVSAIDGINGTPGELEGDYRGICEMLAGLANKELSANYTLTMPTSQPYAQAHFWRSRVLADMLVASSYYKVSAELLFLARETLAKCSPSMKAGEIVLLLNHASALLVDAAKFMSTAGAELGDHDIRRKNLEKAVKEL